MSFSKKISAELAEHDKILNNAALPNASSLLSDPFLCDGSRLGLEIVGEITTGVTIPDGKKLTVELQTSGKRTGTYTTAATLAAPAAGTIATGFELFRFAPVSTMNTWKRIKIVDDADLSAGKLTVRLVHIAG